MSNAEKSKLYILTRHMPPNKKNGLLTSLLCCRTEMFALLFDLGEYATTYRSVL